MTRFVRLTTAPDYGDGRVEYINPDLVISLTASSREEVTIMRLGDTYEIEVRGTVEEVIGRLTESAT